MEKQKACLQTIAEFYPDLPIRSARWHNEDGQYNDILIVNETIIFRFPKYAEGFQTIQDEVRILSRIQGVTTLAVPNPIYTSKGEQRPGKVFMGYAMLPGEPLWRETLQSIGAEETLQRLAVQLAGFLKELHSIPVESLGTDLPVHDSLTEMATMYAEIRTYLFSYMRQDACDGVTHLFEEYLDTPRSHDYPLSLYHGDFGGSNILYNREFQRISGIIDFGFAGLGDPAHDIAAVSTFGESFLARFHDPYPGIESMLERASFYKGTFALSEALHGIKNGDEAAFKAGMAQYI
jgi:aminoglycoside 2''-phosphotransferase